MMDPRTCFIANFLSSIFDSQWFDIKTIQIMQNKIYLELLDKKKSYKRHMKKKQGDDAGINFDRN